MTAERSQFKLFSAQALLEVLEAAERLPLQKPLKQDRSSRSRKNIDEVDDFLEFAIHGIKIARYF